jgi:hypothetical protein
MSLFAFLRRREAPVPLVTETAVQPADLRRFDAFSLTEIRALPPKLRREVIDDRKTRVTALLAREAKWSREQ